MRELLFQHTQQKLAGQSSLHHSLSFILLGCLTLLVSSNLRALDSVQGSMLFVAKGEVEIYHNDRKAVLNDKADGKQQLAAKIPERPLKVGDVLVLRIRSPFVYRVISAAINLPHKTGQIPIKKTSWRFLGEDTDPRKISSKVVLDCQAMLVSGSPDPYTEDQREKLGFIRLPMGSDWVKTEKQINGWCCVGFVLTAEMFSAPLSMQK